MFSLDFLTLPSDHSSFSALDVLLGAGHLSPERERTLRPWKRAESQDGQDQDSAQVLSLCSASCYLCDIQSKPVHSCDSVAEITSSSSSHFPSPGRILANGTNMEGT